MGTAAPAASADPLGLGFQAASPLGQLLGLVPAPAPAPAPQPDPVQTALQVLSESTGLSSEALAAALASVAAPAGARIGAQQPQPVYAPAPRAPPLPGRGYASLAAPAVPQSGRGYTNLGDSLTDVDWSTIGSLAAVRQVDSAYSAVPSMRALADVEQWRAANGISIVGNGCPNPVLTFQEASLPAAMLRSFDGQGFVAPTPIQAQGWSVALAGRDMIGIAKTGSGKTLAFGVPGILHVSAQPPQRPGDGPIMLVLSPTRELACQIEHEIRRVLPLGMRCVCCYGGAPRRDQHRALQQGVGVVIATPGRLIDFAQSRVTNLYRVSFLVLDEADRMLDMGFEPDVRKILGQIRPDRQTLMWSATWPSGVQRLARDFLKDPIQIQVGSQELSANSDVQQVVLFVSGMQQKFKALTVLLQELSAQMQQTHMLGGAKTLVFVATKRAAEELARSLNQQGISALAIHGDKTQGAREQTLRQFRQERQAILVATDVAQRGLDIPDLTCVINFDFPNNLEDYVHRIGRTGRAGNKGIAYSFLSPSDAGQARGLIQLLRRAGQVVPPELEAMARTGGGGERRGHKRR
eukprot:TRINITY_DN3661_c0_g1_i1.p1 TRINITY_DN3661_c0_g1~~TRINITY_DN3661_c0_g1_i1.p1  ORF type:complete len:635 (+),score=126.04 TRINITY_DN3661_c0_g1_i1:170-1906(+)